MPALIIRFFDVHYHELIPNGSTRFNGVMLITIPEPLASLALSICPLASRGYDFANRPKYTAYWPCCVFPGVENFPEASAVYLFVKKNNDPKAVCLMDVRRMGCAVELVRKYFVNTDEQMSKTVF